MASTFAAITEVEMVELSPSDIALVSGGGYDWGVQPPTDEDPASTDNYDWC